MIRTLPNFYTEAQMQALASSPGIYTRKGLRDRAILGLLCASGLRASELCGLLVSDVKPTLVFVRQGKGGAQRYVPISRRCYVAIRRYLVNHPTGQGGRLFRTLDGKPLGRRLLHKIVTSYSRALGLKGGVHTIRSSAATRWLNLGVGLQTVRAMLGHVSIASTAIYLGVATDQLVREYQRAVERA